jgi:4-diphosphocytidyl-2-C-methyl-D-erythritol kinase
MSTALTFASHCKVNLLLNILGRRDDGFHELETLMQPVPLHDQLQFGRIGQGIELTCSEPSLPTDQGNLVHRAASMFLKAAGNGCGVKIHLEKNLPLAAGIGAGSANAAVTLRGLNELWNNFLSDDELCKLAAELGSDVPFFLTDSPGLAHGRGEQVELLAPFPALKDIAILLVNSGFGVSTPWAYRELSNYPDALDGRPGRAQALADALKGGNLSASAEFFYNSLEQPVFKKYPVLPVIRDFLNDNGAIVARMSGSGATLFALLHDRAEAENLRAKYHEKFGQAGWSRTVLL